jgi:hypothetical protein
MSPAGGFTTVGFGFLTFGTRAFGFWFHVSAAPPRRGSAGGIY